jgi:murein DD-endopeptidase MepM/ murein hydrolase activator NlpD
MRSILITGLAVLALAAPAAAATGRASAASGGATAHPDDGGAHFGDPRLTKKKRPGARLTLLRASGSLPAAVRFRIKWRRPVRGVRIEILPTTGRVPLTTIPLGTRRAGRTQVVRVTGAGLPEGSYRIRVVARGLGRARGVAPSLPVVMPGHVFPIQGPYSLGGADARFGAKRDGHTHQGQDLVAAAGLPVVTPRFGTVKAVEYQAGGGGHYVVVDSDRDYVFMHLEAGSIPVREGDAVATGQRIGRVGSTGRSSGAHLHFEIWEGNGWYGGGQPVDPLPFLLAWAGRSTPS